MAAGARKKQCPVASGESSAFHAREAQLRHFGFNKPASSIAASWINNIVGSKTSHLRQIDRALLGAEGRGRAGNNSRQGLLEQSSWQHVQLPGPWS